MDRAGFVEIDGEEGGFMRASRWGTIETVSARFTGHSRLSWAPLVAVKSEAVRSLLGFVYSEAIAVEWDLGELVGVFIDLALEGCPSIEGYMFSSRGLMGGWGVMFEEEQAVALREAWIGFETLVLKPLSLHSSCHEYLAKLEEISAPRPFVEKKAACLTLLGDVAAAITLCDEWLRSREGISEWDEDPHAPLEERVVILREVLHEEGGALCARFGRGLA